LCKADREKDVPLCEYLCRAVDGLAFANLIAFVSQRPRELPVVDEGLPQPLKNVKISEVVYASLAVPLFLVMRAQAVFERDAEEGRGEIDVGTRLLMFLEIYKRLEPIVQDPLFENKTTNDPPRFVASIIGQKNIADFRNCLLQAWNLLEPMFKDELKEVTQLRAIGNPVTQEHIVAITRMLFWFGLWQDIPPEYEFILEE
jgi:hypothetical protein